MPRKIIQLARFILTLRTFAISAPVQPPVPGNGTATNANSPQKLAASTPLLFFCAFSSSFSTSLPIHKKFVLLMKSKIFLINRRIKGIGRKLPTTQMGNATYHSTPRSAAAMRPPRSSRMGKREMIKIIISGESQLLKNSVKL